MISYTEADDALVFAVRVIPRASQSSIAGEHEGALKLRIAAAPVDGAANEEMIRVLAKFFSVARRDLEILSGHTSKTKRVRVRRLSVEGFVNAVSRV